MTALWGIDLGGTKTEGIVVDADQGYRSLARIRIPTEREKGYEHTLDRIHGLIDLLKLETGLSPEAVGFATPGALDPETGRIKNSNSQQLLHQAFHSDLESLLKIPVRLANDANCFTLAETLLGNVPDQVPDARLVFGVILGTGVGGGIAINGTTWDGKQGIGGEWGHNFLDDSGGKCYCGKTGCVETVISGPALEAFYTQNSGIKRSLKEIYQLYKKGNEAVARQTLERLIHFWGKAIAAVVNLLDPDAIVIGGGLGNIPELYDEGRREAEKFVFNTHLTTPILKPKLGDSAGVFGAAMLVEHL